MKLYKNLKIAALAVVGLTLTTWSSIGQTPVISSFSQNGKLVCTDLQPGSTASVEWASSVLGPWTNNWAGLESVTVSPNGAIQVSVPMFYRVRGTPPPSLGKVTFRKWITDFPNQPGLIANMAGVVGGEAGNGTFTGEVLLDTIVGDLEKVEALYHFHGPEHSFTALVHVEQTGATNGSKAVIVGVITDGWMKGQAVKGEYTQIECAHVGIDAFCYEGTLNIMSVAQPPPLGKVTFRKWVTDFPNQAGLIANMAGVVGGDAGNGTFTGEVLLDSIVGSLETVEALYHVNGPQHSFTARLHVEQTGAITGSKAVILGVIIDGWLKGHVVRGEYTQIECAHVGIDAFCYEGSLEIN